MAEKNKRRGQNKVRPTRDRVLQARIPEQLDEELRDRAQQLGLSVSTIVRNVLLHTFELVEGVVNDSAQVGRALQRREEPTASSASELSAANTAPAVPDNEATAVVAWQEAILNLNGICDKCNVILPTGERAALGVPVQTRPVWLCLECLAALSTQPPGKKTQAPSKKAQAPGKRAQPKPAAKARSRSKKTQK